jgi:hypothetical protein
MIYLDFTDFLDMFIGLTTEKCIEFEGILVIYLRVYLFAIAHVY